MEAINYILLSMMLELSALSRPLRASSVLRSSFAFFALLFRAMLSFLLKIEENITFDLGLFACICFIVLTVSSQSFSGVQYYLLQRAQL